EDLVKEKEKFDLEIKKREGYIKELKKKIKELTQENTQQLEQIAALKNYIEKMEVEYKIVNETRKKIKELEDEKRRLKGEIRKLTAKIKKLEDEKIDLKAEALVYKRQFYDIRRKYEEALAKNRRLEKKLAEVPKKFAEIARENKALIKETALMHYNLGVFYTQHKEYKRAIAEFEKAIELNPEDPYAHFNLGYIYAEYLLNRPKAIEHFRHYLRLADKNDKDVDWVKKYILTWQAWEGKTPLK
ncbi:MAG: hypothetical protein DRP81_06275, partial [Candidatus Omnitrophota bacterium]